MDPPCGHFPGSQMRTWNGHSSQQEKPRTGSLTRGAHLSAESQGEASETAPHPSAKVLSLQNSVMSQEELQGATLNELQTGGGASCNIPT